MTAIQSGLASQASVDVIDGIVDDILLDTAEIGVAGAGLSAVPWNAAWDAEVESEATDALNAYDPPTDAELEARTLEAANYATAANLATVDNNVDSILDDTGTSGVAIADGSITDAKLGADMDIYDALIWFTDDEANTVDRYTAVWRKNGVVVTSGITSPVIQVIKRGDGTDLIAETAMTEIGSTSTYKYDEATNRVAAGEGHIIKMSATIDGGTRTAYQPIGQRSTS